MSYPCLLIPGKTASHGQTTVVLIQPSIGHLLAGTQALGLEELHGTCCVPAHKVFATAICLPVTSTVINLHQPTRTSSSDVTVLLCWRYSSIQWWIPQKTWAAGVTVVNTKHWLLIGANRTCFTFHPRVFTSSDQVCGWDVFKKEKQVQLLLNIAFGINMTWMNVNLVYISIFSGLQLPAWTKLAVFVAHSLNSCSSQF